MFRLWCTIGYVWLFVSSFLWLNCLLTRESLHLGQFCDPMKAFIWVSLVTPWKSLFGSALWTLESLHLGQRFDLFKAFIWGSILTPWKPSFGSLFDSWKAFVWVIIWHRESLQVGHYLSPWKHSFGSHFDSRKAFIWVTSWLRESFHLGQCLCPVKAFIWVSVFAPWKPLFGSVYLPRESLYLSQCLCPVKAFIWVSVFASWKPSRGSVLYSGSRLSCALGSRPRPVLGSLSRVTVSLPVVVCLLVPSQRPALCSSLSSSPRMVCSSSSHVATCFCSVLPLQSV